MSVKTGAEAEQGAGGGAGQKGQIVRSGYLKKIKTMKKKWFVLRAESADSSARLEYYDSEKKFNCGVAPKRTIPLKTCFNINKRKDIKHKHVIALYTKDDCFCVQLDSEEEQDSWLKALLSLQHGEDACDGETPKPAYEHVWHIQIMNRGVGTTQIIGQYSLCLTDKTMKLIKKDSNDVIDLALKSIRTCGYLKEYVLLEIGRSSDIGPGELWMDTGDENIAQNIHSTVYHAMTTNSSNELGPKSRNRSCSATESSKPNSTHRKHPGMPKTYLLQQGASSGRERCDSMPTRPRTTSEGNHPVPLWSAASKLLPSYRTHYNRDISHSPPTGSPLSPPSVGCSTESSGSSYSLVDDPDVIQEVDMISHFTHPLTPDEAIAEEDSPDSSYVPMAPPTDEGYVAMSPGGRHARKSPTQSVSSVASSDIRFGEYMLDKVTSYFPPPEDADPRPTRAYSVGSRPGPKKYTELAENSRVRAFSVGSKTKKGPSRVLATHHQYPGVKSSSAPILSFNRVHSSHSSIGPMDDLMEMDFSHSSSTSKNNSNDYMDMKSGGVTPSGYVEMKLGQSVETAPTQTTTTQNTRNNDASFVDLSRLSDYVDMQAKKDAANVKNSYTEPFNPNNYGVRRVDRQGSFGSQISTSPCNKYQSISPKYYEGWSNSPTTPEGYVEMTPGKTNNKHQRQSSLDSSQIKPQDTSDYTNMSLGHNNNNNNNTNMKRTNGKTQPITIQGSNKCVLSPGSAGRKYSSGTPPSLHLPLGSQHSSLPRPRSRKNSRRDSKDSSGSNVTTPSSSSTIFSLSLNSPCSPVTTTAASVTSHAIKVPTSVLNTKYRGSGKSYDDYAVMDYDKSAGGNVKKKDDSEYVNYNPAPQKTVEKIDNHLGDYAIMKPGILKMQTNNIQYRLSGFHPINDDLSSRTSPKPGDTVPELNNSTESLKETARSRIIEEKTSRPNSTSSEVCSSTSTLTGAGSRPESLDSDHLPNNGEIARPPSSADANADQPQQLHYASLDLDEVGRSPKSEQPDGIAAGPSQNGPAAFSYAQIDFVKSEGLKHSALPNNAKVKH
ncbi:unnamed protein product [Brassicogethes aeneus]|uniref:Insulin receptor substrate 1 n=1 Tax=Brassicogethes aeneus TaxID=1431903 RepID=A0A9P0BLJ7_BRAAE|nr:unnamed protein product [Brassicogethes aeneus]